MGGGYEAVGGGDDFAGDAEGLKGGDEGEGAVGEEAYVGHFEVFGEGFFEALVEGAVVGDPFAGPYFFEEVVEFVERGEEGGGNCYLWFCFHRFHLYVLGWGVNGLFRCVIYVG